MTDPADGTPKAEGDAGGESSGDAATAAENTTPPAGIPIDPVGDPVGDPAGHSAGHSAAEPVATPPAVPAPQGPGAGYQATQPVPAEPVPAEPVPGEPVPAQPAPGEPVPAEPVPAEPVPAEPAEPAGQPAQPVSEFWVGGAAPLPPEPPIVPPATPEPAAPPTPATPPAPAVPPTTPEPPAQPAPLVPPVVAAPPVEPPAAPPAVPPTAPVEPPADPDEPEDEDGEDEPTGKTKKKQGSFIRELPFLLLIAFVLALVIKAFFFQAFFIPSGSMEQTLHGCPGCKGDRVLVNKIVYRFRDVNRGEIVVFNGAGLRFQPEVFIPKPRNAFEAARRKIAGAVGLGAPGERDFIKRVIGLPGDTVACCDNGRVTVNGVALNEPYLWEDDRLQFAPVVVPKGHVFVMGDHRGRSSDSRHNGTVPTSKIIGRAFVIVWPPSRLSGLRVPSQIEDAGIPEPKALGAPPWSAAVTPPALGLLGAVPVTVLRRRLRRA